MLIDDITQPVEEHGIYKSFECSTHGSDFISSELDTKEYYALQNNAGHSAINGAISGSVERVEGISICYSVLLK